MEEDQILELAKDKRFIPGIYNYCDRWCERCSLTHRCLNFAMEQEDLEQGDAHDIRNEAFWKKINKIFAQTQKLLEKVARERGIDLKEITPQGEQINLSQCQEEINNHVIFRAAWAYSRKVDEWFHQREDLLKEIAPFSLGGVELKEAFEVIRWYQHFIPPKLARALYGLWDEKEEALIDDADGSAKIALIAIDRSLAAWSVVWHFNRFLAESISEIISLLNLLRQAVEETFPKARSFKRPGFDAEE